MGIGARECVRVVWAVRIIRVVRVSLGLLSKNPNESGETLMSHPA